MSNLNLATKFHIYFIYSNHEILLYSYCESTSANYIGMISTPSPVYPNTKSYHQAVTWEVSILTRKCFIICFGHGNKCFLIETLFTLDQFYHHSLLPNPCHSFWYLAWISCSLGELWVSFSFSFRWQCMKDVVSILTDHILRCTPITD